MFLFIIFLILLKHFWDKLFIKWNVKWNLKCWTNRLLIICEVNRTIEIIPVSIFFSVFFCRLLYSFGVDVKGFNWANTGLLYPYNFVLHFFYDEGLLISLLLFMPLLNSIKSICRTCTFYHLLCTVMFLYLIFSRHVGNR